MNRERRKAKRWILFQEAKFREKESGRYIDCMLSDISFWGARISSQARLQKDSIIQIRMNIPDALHPLITKAKVVHIGRKPRLCYEYGLLFVNLRPNHRERIFDYLFDNYPLECRRLWLKENIEVKGGEEKMLKAEPLRDRRIFARMPVDLHARYFDSVNSKEGCFRVLDISAKGMGIYAKEEIDAGKYLEIWVTVLNSKNPLYTRGQVIWAKVDDKAGGWRAGINLERADFMSCPSILKS